MLRLSVCFVVKHRNQYMKRRETFDDDIQLSLDFGENQNTETEDSNTNVKNNRLSMAKGDEMEIMEQIDALFQQIGKNKKQWFITRLSAFILDSFYVKGLSLEEINALMREGVENLRSVSRERTRMIIYEIRDELLTIQYEKKHTKGINVSKDFVLQVRECSKKHIGHIIDSEKWLSCPRLNAIAFLLRKKVVTRDTVIPWLNRKVILLDDKIEKRLFNCHYLSLYRMLQKEVLPMTFEQITQQIILQKQLKGNEINESLIRFILNHDEVFEKTDNESYQLRFEYLNVTQKIARIIFEKKDISMAEIKRIYSERTGETFSALSSQSKAYPWCVPIGKSKWIFRENGMRELTPSEIVRDYCNEHIRFTFDDVKNHLHSHGININDASVRCYIMKHCRTLNADGNQFCLVSHIPEEEDSLWRIKLKLNISSRKRNVQWRNEVMEKTLQILETAPNHTAPQKEIMHQCLPIFERYEIAYNNFYKIMNNSPLIRKIEIEGKKYLTKTT